MSFQFNSGDTQSNPFITDDSKVEETAVQRPGAAATAPPSNGLRSAAPAAGGFSFGAPSGSTPVVAPAAPAAGGFKFTAPAPQADSRTSDDTTPVSARPVKSAKHYFETMNLADQDYELEEIEESHDEATQAWAVVSTDGKARGRVPESERILKERGLVDNDEARAAIDALDQWDEAGVVEWYIQFMYAEEDGEEHSDYIDETDLAVENADEKGSWDSTDWTVKPVAEAVDGESWKCEECHSVTEWSQVVCRVCNAKGTHPPALEAAKAPKGFPGVEAVQPKPADTKLPSSTTAPAAGGFSFGAPSGSTPVVAPAAPAVGGFSFGAPAPQADSRTSDDTPVLPTSTAPFTSPKAPASEVKPAATVFPPAADTALPVWPTSTAPFTSPKAPASEVSGNSTLNQTSKKYFI